MLFGHQNDDSNQSAPTTVEPQGAPLAPPPAAPVPVPGVNPLAVDQETGVSLPTTIQPDETEASVLDQPTTSDNNEASTNEPALTIPAADQSTPVAEFAPVESRSTTDTPADTSAATPATDNLLHLKQQALSQLSPLISHLDQTPEERFRTTMMLIQSTDNQALLQSAYESAQAITDEKVRAQALLDVVNEINYFTQAKNAA